MKRLKKTVLRFLGLMLILTALAAVIQRKYEPLLAAPVVTHDVVATPRHTLRIVLYPTMAPTALSNLLDLPEWIVAPFAPREIAVLAEPDLNSKKVRLAVFLNDQRLGPVIADYASEPYLSKDVPFIDWDERGCVRTERGSLVLQGDIPLKSRVADLVCALRKSTEAGMAPPLQGGHMFEAALSNEDGGALAALLCLYSCLDSGPPAFDFEVVAHNLSSVKTIHITADFESDDVLVAKLVLTGWPEAEQAMAELAFLTEVVRGELAGELRKDAYKIGVGGGTDRQGTLVTMDIRFSGLAAYFQKSEADA